MKRLIEKTIRIIKQFFNNPTALALWTVIGLVIPGVCLVMSEAWTVIGKISGLLLTTGIYILLMTLGRKTGRTVWCLFPFIFFGAFQMVLLYLYGDGVIAVDMFLNVFTTSVNEAGQLLLNLIPGLLTVVVLYVVPLVWGGVAWKKGLSLTAKVRNMMRKIGTGITAAGAAAMICGWLFVPKYNAVDETFPANSINNLVLAVKRVSQMRHYPETSRKFSYEARSLSDSTTRELYVIVIGETGRAADWQLQGYRRPTNPVLSRQKGVVYFDQAFSESNTTHKSVPMLLSSAAAENFDSIYCYKSIISAFRQAGFSTAFISAQTPNRSYTQFFGNEADTTIYIDAAAKGLPARDGDLLPHFKRILDRGNSKQLIVLHTYGSHFKYNERYPSEFARFTPDRNLEAKAANRRDLINAYDNTILYTDYVLGRIIADADSADCKAAVFYCTDHGEDIFDDTRERFLHASPLPTAFQLHVPMVIWLSDEQRDASPEKAISIGANAHAFLSPQKSMFMTIIDIAGISTPKFRPEWSLASPEFRSPAPVYLDDHNRPLQWSDVHFKSFDLDYFDKALRDKSLSPR